MKYLVLICLITVSFSCKKNVLQPFSKLAISDFTYNLDSFTTWIYEQKSINFNAFAKTIDTQIIFEKHVFDTFFTDNENRIASRISVYTSLKDTNNFKFKYNYYQVVTADALEVVSNNTRFLNLSFPLSIEALWNENAYNNNQQQIMYYSNILEPYPIFTNKSIISIQAQSNPIKNSFEQRVSQRVYGKKIGLIKEIKVNKINKQGFFDGYDKTTKLVKVY